MFSDSGVMPDRFMLAKIVARRVASDSSSSMELTETGRIAEKERRA